MLSIGYICMSSIPKNRRILPQARQSFHLQKITETLKIHDKYPITIQHDKCPIFFFITPPYYAVDRPYLLSSYFLYSILGNGGLHLTLQHPQMAQNLQQGWQGIGKKEQIGLKVCVCYLRHKILGSLEVAQSLLKKEDCQL